MCGPHLHRMTASGHVVDRWLTTVVRFPDPVLVSPTPELVAAVRVLSAAIGQRMIEMAVGAVL